MVLLVDRNLSQDNQGPVHINLGSELPRSNDCPWTRVPFVHMISLSGTTSLPVHASSSSSDHYELV